MKFRYKPHYNDQIVEFDPGNEIICPLCGAVKPVPLGWRTHQTIVICPGSPETHSHNVAMGDINSLLGDIDDNEDDQRMLAYRIQRGGILEEDVRIWLERRTLWFIMWNNGSAPKWKVEPDPFWRRTLAELNKREEVEVQ
jgi:hypothetical protein